MYNFADMVLFIVLSVSTFTSCFYFENTQSIGSGRTGTSGG